MLGGSLGRETAGDCRLVLHVLVDSGRVVVHDARVAPVLLLQDLLGLETLLELVLFLVPGVFPAVDAMDVLDTAVATVLGRLLGHPEHGSLVDRRVRSPEHGSLVDRG